MITEIERGNLEQVRKSGLDFDRRDERPLLAEELETLRLKDVPPVRRFFEKNGYDRFEVNEGYNYLEFHVSQVRSLKKLGVQVGLCSSVFGKRGPDTCLREVKVDLVSPENFILSKDI